MARPRFVRAPLRSVAFAWLVLRVAIVLVAAMTACDFLNNPFGGFDGSIDFAGLSGSLAKRRMVSDWPSSVNPEAVEVVSFRTQWSRDSFSSWYRIKLTKDAAKLWADYLHAEQERYSKGVMGNHLESVEIVHQNVAGPPPLHWQTGETPVWWTPPATSFRATEIMLWYEGFDSGVGRATYSAFDEPTGILWMYDYAAQHDLLWPERRNGRTSRSETGLKPTTER